MATPTTNSVATTVVDPLATGLGKYLVDGTKWGGGLGTGVTLTYSFPTGTAYSAPGYGQSEFDDWTANTTAERTAIRNALAAWSSVANITFVEVADNSTTVGELRFANTDMTDFAHAYTPSNDPSAGDVWFSTSEWNPNGGAVVRGDYDYATILHEIGHALGLKHSFEAPNAIPHAYDSYLFTQMSYTASPWSDTNDNYASSFATTPMYYDLVAIQALYGRNMSHNAGNTTYTYNDGSTYFETIDDAGGLDTIVYNGTQGCTIDLNIAHGSQVSEAVEFSSTSSRKTVWIGPASIIERATGGQGNDVLTGNASNNTLTGRGGNDSLVGNDGADLLVGGLGRDTLNGGDGADRYDFNTIAEMGMGSAHDIIRGFVVGEDRIDLSTIDASSVLAGNNAFTWMGAGTTFSTSSAGQLRYRIFNNAGTANDYTMLYGDTDSDTAAEFEIYLSGIVSLAPTSVLA